jgi:hypothetical protein
VALGFTKQDANLYSHALPWSLLVAVSGALIAWAITRQRIAGWAVLVLAPVHILFDLVSGDKPLWKNGPVGIDLDHRYWQYELLIELALLIGGWLLLRGEDKKRRWAGRPMLIALCVVEFIVLARAISERPWLSRCWIWPLRPCNDSSWLAAKWDNQWISRLP